MNNFTTSFQQQEPANKIHKHKRLLKVPYYQLLKYQQMILMLQKISHQTTQKKNQWKSGTSTNDKHQIHPYIPNKNL